MTFTFVLFMSMMPQVCTVKQSHILSYRVIQCNILSHRVIQCNIVIQGVPLNMIKVIDLWEREIFLSGFPKVPFGNNPSLNNLDVYT